MFTRHPAGGRSRGDHFGVTMWPLAASGGWPLARGQLHSDYAQRMRPYMTHMPGPLARGPYKRGTTVLRSGVEPWQ